MHIGEICTRSVGDLRARHERAGNRATDARLPCRRCNRDTSLLRAGDLIVHDLATAFESELV